jgi:hypothetical protein
MADVRALGVRSGFLCALLAVGAAASCSRITRDLGVCDVDNPCRPGFECNLTTNECVTPGAPVDGGGQPGGGNGGAGAGGGGSGGSGGSGGAGGATCTSDAQCPNPSAPRCVAGRCAECAADKAGAHCPVDRPVCVDSRCVACNAPGAAAGACALRDPSTPICDGGRCLTCTATAGCDNMPMRPGCLMNACVPCAMDPNACARRTATPVCAASGACVECSPTSPCKPSNRPICTNDGRCAGCGSDAQCIQAGAARPACEVATGVCYECLADSHCGTATKPICDLASRSCVPCKLDNQCKRGPGICMEDGHCASDAETILVGPGAGTACQAPPMPTAAMNCPAKGINGALSGQRKVVVIRGAVGDFAISPAMPAAVGRISIYGQNGNVKPPRDAVGITVTAGDVLIKNLTVAAGESADSHGIRVTGAATKLTLEAVTVEGNGGTGVIAEAGTELRVRRCMIKGNGKGGLQIDGAAFDVENTVIAANMGALVPGSTTFYGGAYLKAAAGGRAMAFRNNTIVDNAVAGLVCAAAYPVKGLLVATNTVAQVLMCSVSASSKVDVNPGFDPARPYHITRMSPCYNAGEMTDHPGEDLDGDVRPQGGRSDCGADETP